MGKKTSEGPEEEKAGVKGGVTVAKLNLVDLAGSEKSVAGAAAEGAAILHREGCFINKSLTFLEQVL